MSKKKSKKDPKAVHVTYSSQAEAEKARAITILRPSVTAAASIKAFNSDDDMLNVNALITELVEQSKSISAGNMGRPEAMLAAQMATLDHVFLQLLARAQRNMGQYTQTAELYMKLALRAQSQCRATIETLAMIKNPQPYVRQQNVAYNQQVNNGGQPQQDHARAGKNLKSTGELLEDHSGEWLDTGTQGKASGDDKELATVGEINRTKD